MREEKDWTDVFLGVPLVVVVMLFGFYTLSEMTVEAQPQTDLGVARAYDPSFGGCLHNRLGTCRPNLPQMPCNSNETPVLRCESTGTTEQPGPTPVRTPSPVAEATPVPSPLPIVTPTPVPDDEDYLFKFRVPEGYMVEMSCPVGKCTVVANDLFKLSGPWTVKLVKVGEGR